MTGPENHARTEAIFAFMHDNAQPLRVCPTVREVADEFGVSVSTVHWHVRKLQAQGRLVAHDNKMIRLP